MLVYIAKPEKASQKLNLFYADTKLETVKSVIQQFTFISFLAVGDIEEAANLEGDKAHDA